MKKYFADAALCFLISFGGATMAVAEKAGVQYWQADTVKWSVAKNWSLGLGEEHYFDDDASHYYYQEMCLDLTYSGLAKWFDLSLGYAHVLNERLDVWTREERPQMIATFKCGMGLLDFSDRNKFEYKILENATDYMRYRNLATLMWHDKMGPLEIQPYVANEAFFDSINASFSQDRCYAGISFMAAKQLNIRVYYMRQLRRRSCENWSSDHVLGTRLEYRF